MDNTVTLQEQINTKRRELTAIEQLFVEGEEAFATRAIALRETILSLKKEVRQLQERAREYEIGMRFTREADEKRTCELDEQDRHLKARERRLIQAEADLEKRKRRFQQLKDISS